MTKKEGSKHTKEKVRKSHVVEKLKRQDEFNAVLIENFVSLQKVMTGLVGKIDSLTEQTAKLLQLFEMSAKTFSERLSSTVPDIEKDREFLDKLNKLLDQNKLIAKGLTMMEDKMKERLYGTPSQPAQKYPPLSSQYMPSSMEKEKLSKALEI